MRIKTRQDHIDPQISQVTKCGAPGHSPSNRDTLVIFVNNTWVCSSGHCDNYDELPYLRAENLDPAAWVLKNAVKVAQMLPVEACRQHEEDAPPIDWRPYGHLWTDGIDHTLKLCLPDLVPGTEWR